MTSNAYENMHDKKNTSIGPRDLMTNVRKIDTPIAPYRRPLETHGPFVCNRSTEGGISSTCTTNAGGSSKFSIYVWSQIEN